MKRYLLPLAFFLISIAAYSQDQEQHSDAYNFGYKYGIYIVGAIVLLIILMIVMRKKKK